MPEEPLYIFRQVGQVGVMSVETQGSFPRMEKIRGIVGRVMRKDVIVPQYLHDGRRVAIVGNPGGNVVEYRMLK